jgi:1,4-dihydroxy-2-naphthoate octaprenyltransferase
VNVVSATVRFMLAAVMSGTLLLMMYLPWAITAVVIVCIVLGIFLPYHPPPQNYKQDIPIP